MNNLPKKQFKFNTLTHKMIQFQDIKNFHIKENPSSSKVGRKKKNKKRKSKIDKEEKFRRKKHLFEVN